MDTNIKLTSRPWWVSHAVSTPRGLVVARAHGVSTTIRKPTAQDIADGIADHRHHCHDKNHGDYVSYMLDMTEQDLQELGVTPGILDYPNIVDGNRPTTNSAKNTVTQEQARKVYNDLQSEWCDESDIVDNTPYQKGDDQQL